MKSQMGLRIDEQMSDVLDVLAENGFATTGMIVDRSGYSRPTVSKRLDRLYAAGTIEYEHEPTALWRLIEDPREETETETDETNA